jgi:hypothetical protein
MTTTPRPISDLVADRKRVALQVSDLHKKLEGLNGQLERLDAELFSRLETALSAFGGIGVLPAPPNPAFVMPAPTGHPQNGSPPLPPQQKAINPYIVPPSAPVKHGEIGTILYDHVRDILNEVKTPLKTRDLFNALTAKGVQIPGKDPQNNLSAHLSRSVQFVSGRDGWWFRELA